MIGFLDNVGFLAASSGTGAFTVSTVLAGYQLPAAAGAVDGIAYRYRAFSSDQSQWEIGYGVYTVSTTTIARTTIVCNSAGTTSAINFTAAPNVVFTLLSSDLNCDVVPSLAELAKLDTTKTTLAYVSQDGIEGLFAWRTGNLSSLVSLDTRSGVYKASDTVASTSGAWRRVFTAGEYNVKWFGALGDNSTDDYAAIQGCINFAESQAGGTVLFPAGGYKIGSGLVINTPLIRLKGVGCRYCSIVSTSTNISMISVTAARVAIENLSIFNLVASSGGALIFVSTGATQFTLHDLDLVGGYYCIEVAGGAANGVIRNCVARLAYGGSICYLQNAGDVYIDGCVFDQDWPVAVPASSNYKAARANSTAYSLNDYVTYSGFILQCAQAGTSASSGPSLSGVWYGSLITDGTAKWYIAGIVNSTAVTIDSQCTYITLRNTDLTGAFYYGVTVIDTLVSGKPDVTVIDTCTTAGIVVHGFNIVSAKGIWLKENEIQASISSIAGRSGIALGSGFTGEVTLRGNRVTAGFVYGVFLGYGAGGSALLAENSIFGMSTAGIVVSAGVSDFNIINNNLGLSASFGANAAAVIVAAGASDHYQITQNRIHGATVGIIDGGTGTNKVVTPNY